MTDQFIASFNKDVVRTDFVSESNSIKYKLELGGAHGASPNPFLKRNGTDLLGSFVDGMNVREFNSIDGSPSIKSFNFSKTSGNSVNSAFSSYINASTAKFIVLISGKNLYSATDIDTWFKNAGSVAWPGQFMCNNYKVGYVAIYSPSLKKIVAEVAKYSDGNDTDLAEYKCICDVENDLGSLGLPKKIIYDESEKTATDKQGVYNYYINTLLPSINIKSGDNLLLSCDMFRGTSNNKISVLWFSGSTVIDSTAVPATTTTYQNYETTLKVPETADRLAIYVEKYGSDLVGCKNVSLVQITEPKTNSTTAYMGVNGIKATKIVEKSEGDLLNLKMKVSTQDNVVPVVNIQEATMNIKYEHDFTSGESLPNYLSISRMSGGSYFDKNGNFSEVDSDVPRFDFGWDGSKWFNKGLMVEKQSTNLLNYSNATASQWVQASSIKENTSRPVQGFNNCAVVTTTRKSVADRISIRNYTPLVTGDIITTSNYMGIGTANYIAIGFDYGGGGWASFGMDGTKVRYVNPSNATTLNYEFDNRLNIKSLSETLLIGTEMVSSTQWFSFGQSPATDTDNIVCYEAQSEKQTYKSSLIRTNGTNKTRAQDYLILKLSNYTGSVKLTYLRQDNNQEESIYVDCKNLTNAQISDSIPVGCYLKNIKVYEYTLSEKEKNV